MNKQIAELNALWEKYGGDVRQILQHRKKLEIFYALAPLRENLLEWMDLDASGRVLQIGADSGALTGLLARRTAQVTVADPDQAVLDFVRRRWKKESYGDRIRTVRAIREEAPGSYDYVTVIGTLDPERSVREQLDEAAACLKKGGTLILACANTYGAKYLAGAPRDPVTLTREQLDAYLPGGSCYYPLPDWRVATEIYSDAYLPAGGELGGMPALYDMPEYLLMDVGEFLSRACLDGKFPQLTNAYLFVWTKGAQ